MYLSSLSCHPHLFNARYFFPRQLLIPHFWTPRQQVEFRGVYNSLRAQHHWPVLNSLENTSQQVKDRQLQRRLTDLCTKVRDCICWGNTNISKYMQMTQWTYIYLFAYLFNKMVYLLKLLSTTVKADRKGWSCVKSSIFGAFSGEEWIEPSSVWNPCCPNPVLRTSSGHTPDVRGSHGQWDSSFTCRTKQTALSVDTQMQRARWIWSTLLLLLFTVHQRRVSPLLFLSPRFPGVLIGRRLNTHAFELLLLDRALSKLGHLQLSDSELRQVRSLCIRVYSLWWTMMSPLYAVFTNDFTPSGLLSKRTQLWQSKC